MMNKKKTEYVQDIIPVKNIQHGIVETTDGRYIRILEIEPINFMLRSEAERIGIISAFASWLKISPVRLQFKSVTGKADAGKHIDMLRKERKREDNQKCRELSEDYIKLLRDVGNKEALTRRFFLIFQYEDIHRTDDYGTIYGALQTAEQNARMYFLQCGNSILWHENEDEAIAEILYMYFNRRSCTDEPFKDRVHRVMLDRMKIQGKIFGVDDLPEIPAVDFFAPRGINLTKSTYIIMDGVYYSFLYVKSNGYPTNVSAGWMSLLVNAGDGIDVDIHLRRENRSRTVDKVAQRIRLNRTKLKNSQDTSTDYDELSNSVEAGYYIKNGLSNNNEDLFYMNIFITVSARTLDDMLWRRQQIIDMMKAMDIQLSECRFQQEAALMTVMPFLYIAPSLDKKSKRNVLTSGAASTYMFTSFEMSDESGVLLGVNKYNNSLCMLDLFNTKKYKNANLNIIGTSGAGKTFTLQLLALRMRMRGIQCFTIAPIKGHEFRRACKSIGGSFIKIAPGSPHCINVMEIRHTVSPEATLTEGDMPCDDVSVLARKIQQLMIFFSLLIPDMTNEEEQLLDEALLKTYADFGITHDNESLYEGMSTVPPKMKPMPILGDLYKNLQGNKMTERIAVILSRFVTGSAQSFNRQTNVDLSNKYIVIDLSELKGKLLPVGMMIVLDYIWDNIKSDITEKKAVIIDEIWQLVGASSNKMAAEFCLTIFKTIRGFGGSAIAATQDLSDFFGLDDGRYGGAIINNSQNKIVLNLEYDEAEYVKEVLRLSNAELMAVTHFERGEALICSGNSKVPVSIRASEAEEKIITTDREELKKIFTKDKK